MLNLRQFNVGMAENSGLSGGDHAPSIMFRVPQSFLGNISEPLEHGMGMGAQGATDHDEDEHAELPSKFEATSDNTTGSCDA